MADYSLRLYAPVLVAAGSFVEDMTTRAKNWRRTKRANGGDWLGTFRLYDSEAVLRTWFNERLGFHFEERYGLVTWEGMIWEMEYTHLGISRRRSLDGVANAVKALYTDETDTIQESTWATQAQSLAQYGRMEELIVMDGYPQATAEGRRDKVLAERAWPAAKPVGGRRSRESYLDVTVAGYIFTGNNLYVTAADGLPGNANVWIENIVGTDLEFFSAGRIATNAFQVIRELTVPQRAMETLTEIAELGDNSQVPWRIFSETGRRLSYQQVDKTPRYYLHSGKIYDSSALKTEVAPWLMEAGVVVRDMEYPVSSPEQGAWLDDGRDIYLEEITASEGGISWSTEEFSETELLAAQEDYQRRLSESVRDMYGEPIPPPPGGE